MITVKSKDEKFKVDGNPDALVFDNLPEPKQELQELGVVEKENKNFLSMDVQQLSVQLQKFKEAVKIIKKEMLPGIHYLEIPGMEKPLITNQGASWLAASTNMTVEIEELKEVLDFENNFVFYQHRATCSWGSSRKVTAEGSCNSKEYNQENKYNKQDSKKSVYDVMNDVLQMSQKRARQQGIKIMIAMTDYFETNEDNPLASNRKRMGVYTIFYKHFMKYAPKAPTKRKLKNGKWKQFTEKDKLTWQKEYLKNKYFTPNVYELGLPTFANWGIKDVERLEGEIPHWPKRYMELTEYDKELLFLQEQQEEEGKNKNGKAN